MHTFPSILLIWLTLAVPTSAAEWTFVTEDFPPFTYRAEPFSHTDAGAHQAKGPLVEIVQAVCSRLRQDCSIKVHPWRRALRQAEQGEADGIFTVVRSPQRERAFHITRMLVTSRYSVFARDGSAFVYSQPGDLAGRVIGVYGPSGTSYVLSQRIEPVSDVQIHLTASNRRLLQMLYSGRFGEHGLAVLNQDVAWHLIREEQLDGLYEAGELARVSYGIGLSRKRFSEAQFQAFERALDALIADGTVSGILRRHQLEAAY
ncbi:transporter substrate-binding domain-containing protein [Pseudomonas sp. Q2-TVG4-2]|uniref:substrate-binding periplasmic protein n=1 Tax=Pseudomonas sp. Q2-TVG4-2 TaxID=1685699 RepID=UPI0028122525|nr:transporter substrate-binding domain-containing protein [Pseudomonas sp. Q2-TVG4-2]